jgi:hypothetical protein
MWFLLFITVCAAIPIPGQSSSPAQPPPLVVQVVDPAWFPIPGAEVKLESLSRNTHSISMRTDNDGYAKFFVPVDGDYTIEASFAGFKNGRLKRIHLSQPNRPFPTAYVQLQLRVLDSGTKVY